MYLGTHLFLFDRHVPNNPKLYSFYIEEERVLYQYIGGLFMSETPINSQYKDRLFKLVFKDKKDLLQLYNAVNDTDYDNPDDVEVNTLEDVVYMGMRNDISFLITNILNLYEHQSTFSPNLPLRGLLYFARLYQKIVGNDKKIYSGKLLELPYPQFVVFYNGTKNEPERQVLKLSDAFPKWSNEESVALECKAVVLNINLGYNKEVMEKCKKLKEYAQYVARVRAFLDAGFDIETAIDKATDECIEEGILEQILRDNRGEVRSMLLTQYDEQAHIEYEKELSFEEGKEEGIKEGISKGVVAVINAYKSFGVSKSEIEKRITEEFGLREADAHMYMETYWEN